jgi:hypothetical protein
LIDWVVVMPASLCSGRAGRHQVEFPSKNPSKAATLSFQDCVLYNEYTAMTPAEWLTRVRHDLVKRLVWPARDRRDLGGSPSAGELEPDLIDEEGRPISAEGLWTALAAEAPAGANLAAFGLAVKRAAAAAHAGDVHGVIALEAAYAELAHSLNRKS